MNKEQEAREAESLARKFHEAYERLAPDYGYETRTDTKQFDPESHNGQLMIAVASEILLTVGQQSQPWVSVDVEPERTSIASVISGQYFLRYQGGLVGSGYFHWESPYHELEPGWIDFNNLDKKPIAWMPIPEFTGGSSK